MLALACDVRVMAEGLGHIGLNEAAFGSSLFAEFVAIWYSPETRRELEKIVIRR